MSKIDIVGLGPGNIEHLTLGTYKLLKNSDKVFVRTMEHPTIDELLKESINIESFDSMYENAKSFEEVYEGIAKSLIEETLKGKDIVYAVPGHPLFAEKTVEILIQLLDNNQDNINMKVHSSMSFLDVVITALKEDPINGMKILNATSIKEITPDPTAGNVITQLYDRFIASEVKLALLQSYSPDKEVIVLNWCGIEGREEMVSIPLYQLDHLTNIDHLTTLYIPKDEGRNNRDISTLLNIMKGLRENNGCPWDKKQNHKSLRRYLVEETYEVIHAIDKEDYDNLVEELGDLLFQVIFHCQLGEEEGIFDFNDVLEKINEKMIFRHPHVFKEGTDYHENKWEELKKEEKGLLTQQQWEVMDSIPKSMPTLYLADKIQKKAKNVGFDWQDPLLAIEKITEETNELKESLKIGKKNDIMHEIGDVLFSVVNVSRMIGIDPDEALHSTIDKFIQRFRYIEENLEKNGHKVKDYDLETMEKLWQESKITNQ